MSPAKHITFTKIDTCYFLPTPIPIQCGQGMDKTTGQIKTLITSVWGKKTIQCHHWSNNNKDNEKIINENKAHMDWCHISPW